MINKIKNIDGFISESIYVGFFQNIYNKAPLGLREIVDATKLIKQNSVWHPEIFVYDHTKYVTNRLHNTYNDINLSLAGFFHDLGKIKTTMWDEKKESWVSPNHESYSSDITKKFGNWIEEQGGDINTIIFIVENHMRIKFLDDFRLQEKIKFTNDPLFDDVLKFNSADYGGTELECRPLMDLSQIEKDITEYNKREKENKIIVSKFNGKIIMDLYPNLKGKDLGNAINGFKNQSDDFTWYGLNTPKDQILMDFDKFYKQ